MRRVVTALLVCAAAAGCSGDPEVDAKAGFGIPRQPSPSAYAGERQAISGTVDVQPNGCLALDLGDQGLRWIVWPDDTTTHDDADPVLGEDVVVDGDALTGTGTITDASTLPHWADDQSYLGSFGRYCSADTLGVVVLDDATRVDP